MHLVGGPEGFDGPSLVPRREKISQVCTARNSVWLNLDGHDEIEAHQAQVGKVLPGQPFRVQMGVDETKTPEVPRGETVETKIRDEYAAPVADEDVGDLAPAIQEEAELPVSFSGQLRQPPHCFRRHDLPGPRFGPAETLDALDLGTPQPGCFAFYFSDRFLLTPSFWRGW